MTTKFGVPSSGTDRPVVTFALLAYNQDRFIEEAIEGAFAQTYSPLEIILSDDCSTDQTFKIMQDMAAVYIGPHKVRAVKTSNNAGIFNHFLHVVQLAQGPLVVMAAGDDISNAERTQVLFDAWQKSGAVVMTSIQDMIDEYSRITNGRVDLSSFLNHSFFRNAGSSLNIHGATAAYAKDFICRLPTPERRLMFEDEIVAWLRLLLDAPMVHINMPLVRYRIHASNLSQRGTGKGLSQAWANEVALNRNSGYRADCIEYFRDTVCPHLGCNLSEANRTIDSEAMQHTLHFCRLIQDWWNLSFWKRITRTAKMGLSKHVIRWVAPRMGGKYVFILLKTLRRRASPSST